MATAVELTVANTKGAAVLVTALAAALVVALVAAGVGVT